MILVFVAPPSVTERLNTPYQKRIKSSTVTEHTSRAVYEGHCTLLAKYKISTLLVSQRTGRMFGMWIRQPRWASEGVSPNDIPQFFAKPNGRLYGLPLGQKVIIVLGW